ncbi:segregation/condensation protein A [Collibacillus ludicampi]
MASDTWIDAPFSLLTMDIQVKLQAFEGPLDLLLHLIERAEVDIHDIPIAEITAQYLSYVEAMQELQLDVASEFLVMASTLLAIKSKMLLPRPVELTLETDDQWQEEEEDPRIALMERLIEYKKFKQLAEELKQREEGRSHVYTRPPENLTVYLPDDDPNPVEGISLYDLLDAFTQALARADEEEPQASVQRDEVSVKERVREIEEELRQKNGRLLFSSLLSRYRRRSEIIVTFLAVLELMKARRIRCVQDRLFSEIIIEMYV